MKYMYADKGYMQYYASANSKKNTYLDQELPLHTLSLPRALSLTGIPAWISNYTHH